jgi:hypothetical protein
MMAPAARQASAAGEAASTLTCLVLQLYSSNDVL